MLMSQPMLFPIGKIDRNKKSNSLEGMLLVETNFLKVNHLKTEEIIFNLTFNNENILYSFIITFNMVYYGEINQNKLMCLYGKKAV